MDIKKLNSSIQEFNRMSTTWEAQADEVTNRPIKLFQGRQLKDEAALIAVAEHINDAGKSLLQDLKALGFNPVGLPNGEPCRRDSGGRIVGFCTFPPVPEES